MHGASMSQTMVQNHHQFIEYIERVGNKMRSKPFNLIFPKDYADQWEAAYKDACKRFHQPIYQMMASLLHWFCRIPVLGKATSWIVDCGRRKIFPQVKSRR